MSPLSEAKGLPIALITASTATRYYTHSMVGRKTMRLKILLLVSFAVLSLVGGGYVGCAAKDGGSVAAPTTTPKDGSGVAAPTTTPAYARPCWGAWNLGDYRSQGGNGWVYCWTGYGMGLWSRCWTDSKVGSCWDGNDVFCRDDGGERWGDCYDYYHNGKTWDSSVADMN